MDWGVTYYDRLCIHTEMKRLFTLLLALLPVLTLHAQDGVLQRIIEANSPDALSASFVMQRHSPMLLEDIKAEGVVFLKAPDKIRWELQRPSSKVTIFNGDIPSAQHLTLPREKDFACSAEETSGELILVLIPLRKDLKRMFTRIVLQADKKTLLIHDVMLFGKDGEETSIKFSNIDTDADIPQELFIKE